MRLVVIGLAGLLFASAFATRANAIEVGDPLPKYKLYDLDGEYHSLGGRRRAILLIHLFGASADVCQRAASKLETDFHRRYGNRGLQVLGAEIFTGHQADAEAFREFTRVTFPILLGGTAFGESCGLAYNSFLVVDSEGFVRYISEGPDETAYDAAALAASVELHLQEVSSVDLQTWGAIKSLYDR